MELPDNLSFEEIKAIEDMQAILDMRNTDGYQIMLNYINLQIEQKLLNITNSSEPNVVFGNAKEMAGMKSILQALEDLVAEGRDILEMRSKE